MKWHWAALFLLLLAANSPGQEAPPRTEGGTQAWVYPFVEKGRWGYISQDGAWLVPPRYDEVGAETQGELLPVREGKKWGLVDRSGAVLLEPQFANIEAQDRVLVGYSSAGAHVNPTLLVLAAGKVKQIACDDLEDFSEGAAWAARGKYLGLLSESGEWKVAPNVPWGADRSLPEPLHHGVSWYEQPEMMWGLIGNDGRVLLKPIVNSWEHRAKDGSVVDYERNAQPWSDGKTWVRVKDNWKLITLAGKELATAHAEVIRRWGKLPCYAATYGNWAVSGDVEHLTMVGFDGKIYLDADIKDAHFHNMPSPEQLLSAGERSDLSKVPWDKLVGRMKEHFTASDGSQYHRETWYENGCALCIKTIHTLEKRVGAVVGLDLEGHELFQLPGVYDRVEQAGWGDGLAGVVAVIDPSKQGIMGQGAAYVDATGKIVIPPKYGYLSEAFHQGFAWVVQYRDHPPGSDWGLIDRSGNQILPYKYREPGRFFSAASEDYPWHVDSRPFYKDLVVIMQDNCKGLVTREGKVALPPVYREIGDMTEGRAVVSRWDTDQQQMRYGAIDEEGRLVLPANYWGMTAFCKGVSWVQDSHGVGLIDRDGRVLLPLIYSGIADPNELPASGGDNPFETEDLCCVHSSEGWGWVDEKGHMLRWSKGPPPQRSYRKPLTEDPLR